MDFIEKLPVSERYDSIFMIVDRLSKYGHFMALRHPYTTKKVVDVFISEVVRLHGFPSAIVSDRDKLFMSSFWTELSKCRVHRLIAAPLTILNLMDKQRWLINVLRLPYDSFPLTSYEMEKEAALG